MDTLDLDDPHDDRKMRDLQRRYDEKYDEIAELEMQIEEVRNKLRNIHREVITSDNIYKILLAFDEVYACSTEAEKELMQVMIGKVEIYPEKRKDGCWVRSLTFKFPIPTKEDEVKEFPVESLTTI